MTPQEERTPALSPFAGVAVQESKAGKAAFVTQVSSPGPGHPLKAEGDGRKGLVFFKHSFFRAEPQSKEK